jgi:hypothetical protein
MTSTRWDETWHRLREWTNGQTPSERLAAQLLLADDYESLDPSHPLGGPDGGADISCTKDGRLCIAAVYFARGQQRFGVIRSKFVDDFRKVISRQPPVDQFVFITNQEIHLADRKKLTDKAIEYVGSRTGWSRCQLARFHPPH